jgi:predicted HicB family RNase H-like nuclease
MSDETKDLKIRLPAELHQQLKLTAERNHRSMNQQALAYIQQGVTQDARKEQRSR